MKVEEYKIDRSSWDEISIDGWFKAQIPPNWEMDDSEEDVMIFDPNGFGEICVNFLEKNLEDSKKEAAVELIEDWSKQLGLTNGNGNEITMFKRSKDLLVMTSEFIAEEPEGEIEFWRIYAVVGKVKVLDVSYSCPVEDRDREEALIDGIVDSITLVEPENGAANGTAEPNNE